MDMGSAVMTAEMVLETMNHLNIRMADCPIAEGAVVGTVRAVSGASMEEILEELATLGATPKIS